MSGKGTDLFPGCPPEISSAIFESVVWDDFHFPTRSFDLPALLPLSQVCQSWRELIYSTPLLWSALRLHNPHPDPLQEFQQAGIIPSNELGLMALDRHRQVGVRLMGSFLQLLSKWMEQSSSLPFYLKVTVAVSESIPLDTILLPSNANRFQSLELAIKVQRREFARSFPLIPSELQHHFPLLNHFRISNLKENIFVRNPIVLPSSYESPDTGPARGCQWPDSVTQKLTRLHLNIPLQPFDAHWVLSNASPGLVECTIEVLEAAHHLPGFGRLNKGMPKPFFHLTSFTLVLHIPSSLEFLGSWSMPALEELTIRGWDEGGGDGGNRRANEFMAIRQIAFEKRASASVALRSVTFDTVPWINKDDILTLTRSSRSLSHLTLLNMAALNQAYGPLFSEFTTAPQGSLKMLSIGVAIGANGEYNTPQTFPTADFVQFIDKHELRIKVEVRLWAVNDKSERLVEDLETDIKAELLHCGVEKGLWPNVKSIHGRVQRER
ncbi:hypothetical protein BKA70DRAFT_1300804 [Coprinopsis sp. MPI-PUGE-AT-0042]|nr:hypothetical protein BKA70DRAFT_1300804 [Coprinopsis sp. MPI-PUGE-AT-0042]